MVINKCDHTLDLDMLIAYLEFDIYQATFWHLIKNQIHNLAKDLANVLIPISLQHDYANL